MDEHPLIVLAVVAAIALALMLFRRGRSRKRVACSPAQMQAVLDFNARCQRPVRVECAWCGMCLKEGTFPASHGICPECSQEFFGKKAGEVRR